MQRIHLAPLVIALMLVSFSTTGSAIQLEVIETPAQAHSLAPRLVATEKDTIVLSWLEATETGHRFMLAEFDGEQFGTAQTVAQGDDFFANWADTPGIRVTEDGTWLAHWLVRSGRGTYAYDVVMAISHDRGRHWSSPFSPHDDGTLTEHGFVSTFPVPGRSDSAGAIWLDGRETQPAEVDQTDNHHHHHGSGNMTLRTAQINRDGVIEHPQLLDERVCDCCSTAAAVTDEGVVVVYRDRTEDEVRDISIIRQDGSGWTEPVPVHQDGWVIAGCPVNGPAVIAQDRQVVVAWFTLADDIPRIHLTQSSDGGRSFSVPTALDPGTAIGRVGLAWVEDGFVLTWMAQTDDLGVLRLAQFNAGGKQVAQADLTTLDQGRISGVPVILSGADSKVWISWTEGHGEPAKPKVFYGKLLLNRQNNSAEYFQD